jgi:hypothetical protein
MKVEVRNDCEDRIKAAINGLTLIKTTVWPMRAENERVRSRELIEKVLDVLEGRADSIRVSFYQFEYDLKKEW